MASARDNREQRAAPKKEADIQVQNCDSDEPFFLLFELILPKRNRVAQI